MTLLQLEPNPLALAPEPTEVAQPAASEAAAQPAPIIDQIRFIAEMEGTLAMHRNQLRRRVNSEPLTPKTVEALANFARDGETRARTARRRYRGIESAMIHHFPALFDRTKRFDWRRSGDAALKLALSRANNQNHQSLDDAIALLTPDELESYSYLRRRTQTHSPKASK